MIGKLDRQLLVKAKLTNKLNSIMIGNVRLTQINKVSSTTTARLSLVTTDNPRKVMASKLQDKVNLIMVSKLQDKIIKTVPSKPIKTTPSKLVKTTQLKTS